MKVIKLVSEQHKILVADEAGNAKKIDAWFKTTDLIDNILNQRFQKEGFSVKEINGRIKLLEKLEVIAKQFQNDKEQIVDWQVEDAEYELIAEVVRKMDQQKLFVVVNQFVVDFATPFLQ
jgi:hypothetical protein